MASSGAGDPARDHLVWKRTRVEGRSALYGVAGEGPPVVFVHGWALGSHSYKRALKRLVGLGLKVFAPALPGFGGTADLPEARFSTPTIGRESMIGELGQALTDVSPEGTVELRAAPWRARTNRATPIRAGQPVRVVGLDGLLLEVEPEGVPATDRRPREG